MLEIIEKFSIEKIFKLKQMSSDPLFLALYIHDQKFLPERKVSKFFPRLSKKVKLKFFMMF